MKFLRKSTVLALLLATSCVSLADRQKEPELVTVPYVDLNKYIGQWYEIASFPQSFTKGCTGTTADYSFKKNGKIRVENTCFLNSLEGKKKVAVGTAEVADKKTNAKLKVSFFWPFKGDYWIIELGQNYEYAVVGHPDRDYLWILSRTPQMDENLYQELLMKVKAQGYDLSPLQRTLQPKL